MTDTGYMFASLSFLLVSAWALRAIQTKNYWFYLFMVWNMLLAAVPALAVLPLSGPENLPGYLLIILSLVWLLFLPNAFYLLTDLMHLNQNVLVNKRDDKYTPSVNYVRGDALYIFDSMLLFLTALFGSITGGFALMKYYEFLAERSQALAVVLMAFAIFACAAGVYIGRYGRWNSWDAITKPWAVVADFIKSLSNLKELKRVSVVIITMVLFEVFSWIIVSKF